MISIDQFDWLPRQYFLSALHRAENADYTEVLRQRYPDLLGQVAVRRKQALENLSKR